MMITMSVTYSQYGSSTINIFKERKILILSLTISTDVLV